MTSLRVAFAIPAGFALAALATRAINTHPPAFAGIGLVQPLAVATAWHAYGALLLGTLTSGIAIGAWAYVRIVRRGAGAAAIATPATLTLIVAVALVAAWCVPVVFSSDAYAYAAYGELARTGGDAYAHVALPGGNALFDAAVVQWGNPIPACVYGLPFVWLAAGVVAAFAGSGVTGQLGGIRLLGGISLCALAIAAYAAYRGDRAQRLTAAATIVLNPVTIWCCAEGHNDALALAIAVAGFAVAAGGRTVAGAAIAAVSGAVKLPGLLASVPLARSSRERAAAAFGAAVALALSAPVVRNALHGVDPHARYAPQASLQAVAAAMVPAGTPHALAIAAVLAAIAALGAAGACAWQAARRLRDRASEGWVYLALGGWLLVPNPYPWYGIWLLAAAAVAPRTPAAATAIGLSFAAMLRYVPDAVWAPHGAAMAMLGAAALLPYLLLLRRRAKPVLV